jgi:hypothetical protein
MRLGPSRLAGRIGSGPSRKSPCESPLRGIWCGSRGAARKTRPPANVRNGSLTETRARTNVGYPPIVAVRRRVPQTLGSREWGGRQGSVPPSRSGYNHIDITAPARGANQPLPPIRNRSSCPISLSLLTGVGLNLMPASATPDDQANTRRHGTAQRHGPARWSFLPPLSARRGVSAWPPSAVVHICFGNGALTLLGSKPAPRSPR